MKFTYQASDGYVGKDRPLHCSVPDDEILACDTDEDAFEMVTECIEEDFSNKVSAGYDVEDIREAIARIRKKNSFE